MAGLYSFILFVATLYVANCRPAALREQFDHALFMDESEKYELLWTVDRQTSTIHFAAVVNTTGWVGFGISKGISGQMAAADIAIGFVANDGKGYLVDRYAISEALPLRDEQQDYVLTNSQELNGQTILQFNRALVTCDSKDNEIQEGTTRLLFAYHDSDPTSPTEDATIAYHGATTRGSRSVNLLSYVKRGPSQHGLDIKYADVASPNVRLPKKDTIYWCSTHKITQQQLGGRKRHVIEIAPVIQAGHEGLVHHIVVYECAQGLLNDSHLSTSFECKNQNMPPAVRQCQGSSILYVWAIGGETFRLPKNVGLPIGADQDSYYVLEIHYDNPQIKEGLVDTSGIRFYYGDTLRQYEAGTLYTGLGVAQNLMIPPGQKDFGYMAYCDPSCSENFASSKTGVLNVFAAFPHMHTAGIGLWTKLVRKGKEIKEIIRDDNYDFNYQQTHMLPEEIVVKPGDSLTTQCRFNTESRKYITFGGESAREEMCISFLLYYPRASVMSCSSDDVKVSTNFSAKYAPVTGSGLYKRYNWTGIPWSQNKTDELKKVLEDPMTFSACAFRKSNTTKKMLEYKRVRAPVITDPLPSPPSECPNATSRPSTTLDAASQPPTTKPTGGSGAYQAIPFMQLIVMTVVFVSLISTL